MYQNFGSNFFTLLFELNPINSNLRKELTMSNNIFMKTFSLINNIKHFFTQNRTYAIKNALFTILA